METWNLSSGLRRIGLGLDGLLEGLNVLLDILALVLVLEPEGLVLYDLLLLRQIGLRLLLRRHLSSASNISLPKFRKTFLLISSVWFRNDVADTGLVIWLRNLDETVQKLTPMYISWFTPGSTQRAGLLWSWWVYPCVILPLFAKLAPRGS